jgi:hypothetical protein
VHSEHSKKCRVRVPMNTGSVALITVNQGGPTTGPNLISFVTLKHSYRPYIVAEGNVQ